MRGDGNLSSLEGDNELTKLFLHSKPLSDTLIKTEEQLIPQDAHSFEVFAIKETEEGKQAFIGFRLSNGDFHFIGVPYTEPFSENKFVEIKNK
jgi:hypothetical protein